MSKLTLALAASAAAVLTAGAACAEPAQPIQAGHWLVNLRATDIFSNNDSVIRDSTGADTGLRGKIGHDVKPTLGITYFVTDKVGLDLTLGTTEHAIRAVGPGVDIKVRDQWVLPPVLTVQYHPLPKSSFSPYVGAGINYMFFYKGHDEFGFHTDLKNGVGWALQAGANIAVQGPWVVNVDAKKVFFKTDAIVNDGALTSHVDLDPWVLSAGFGRKF
jgi:outer membrane protein